MADEVDSKLEKLEGWSVVGIHPYAPPESNSKCLSGVRSSDGKKVRTSPIDKVDGRVVTTKTGSKYLLGVVAPEYYKWCWDNKVHIPTESEPIKV